MYRGPRKRARICWSAVSIITLFLIFQFGYFIIQKNISDDKQQDFVHLNQKTLKTDFRSKPFKTVHLDLKGAPPLLSYIRKILPMLATAGCDSLLIEYEDMFPYTGRLANLSAGNAYTRQQIKTLLSWAHDLNIQVIPLVQTFGHLEFALKLNEWKHLREVPIFPQAICPSKDGSLELIEEIINQVMLIHKGTKYLHIGADEVFHLAVCTQCIAKGMTSRELYADHVSKIAEYVRSTYPGVTPIIWDDMIRTAPHLLGTTTLPQLVEPMIWTYTPEVSQQISTHVMHWYSKYFDRIWIAGAFKGAGQPTELLPALEFRYLNQMNWLRFARNYNVTKIVGFVLTGWSRFDHFAVLCELLPPSLPSLLLNLYFIHSACNNDKIDEEFIFEKWKTSLSCPNNFHFTFDTLKKNNHLLSSCNFPGTDLYEVVISMIERREIVNKLVETLTKTKGWMTEYNIKHNYTNTWYIQDYRDLYVINAIKEITSLRNYTEIVMYKYFDKYVVNEWTEQIIQPLLEKLLYLNSMANKLINRTVWQRRPIQ